MKLEIFNDLLGKLASEPNQQNLLNVAHGLMEWMAIEHTDKPKILRPKTDKLKKYLQERKELSRPDLRVISKPNQPIEVRIGMLHNIGKNQLYYLVDRDTRIDAWQNEPGPIQKRSKTPYIFHFATDSKYEKLLFILHQNGQKRIMILRDRLSQTQYNKILQAIQDVGKLESKYEIQERLWNCLDLKEVNKSFYKEVKTKYDALVEILKYKYEVSEGRESQFAVRLIGRYIFCWFLKEKGIIDPRIISSHTIQHTEDYYEYILKKLFFNTLNTEVGLRDVELGVPSEIQSHLKRIPYLNGGLFDFTPEDLFFQNLELNDWLIGFVKVLEQYDFTVDESSPSYQQIAIDPEMLGRIFENLLASINPETEKLANERKAFGAFYTPREIVEYMVNQSLRSYLETHLIPQQKEDKEDDFAPTLVAKEPAAQLDIFRPTAVQTVMEVEDTYKKSGEEIAREKEEERKRKEWAEKLDKFFEEGADNPFSKEETAQVRQLLDNCKVLDPACGSGAFPMGVLYKLEQLHETLGVAEHEDELRLRILSNNIFGVDIMPMAVDISRLRAWLSIVLVAEYKSNQPKNNFNVHPLPNLDFKFVCANTLIDVPEDEYVRQMAHADLERFDRLTREYFGAKFQQKDELKAQIQECLNAITETHEIAIRQIMDSATKHEKSDKKKSKDLDKLKDRYAKDQERWKSYTHIFENKPVGFFKTRYFFPAAEKGFDVVIGNPPYISKSLPEEIKIYIREYYKTAQYQLELYVAFIERGIHLLNSKGVISYITPNSWMKNLMFSECRKFMLEHLCIEEIFPYLTNVFESASVDTSIFISKRKSPFTAYPTKIKTMDFKEAGVFQLNEVNQRDFYNNENFQFDVGLSGLGRTLAQKIRQHKGLIEFFEITRGINPYDAARGQEKSIIENKIYHSKIKKDDTFIPELRGKHIAAYSTKWDNKSFVSYGPWLAAPREPKFFNGDRILMRQIPSKKLVATFITDEFIIDQSIFIAILKKEYQGKIDMKYCTALLNSSLMAYFFRYTSNEFDKLFPKLKLAEFKALPIMESKLSLQNIIALIVDQILALKKADPNADSSALERQIDMMVYHLYGLTLEEARVVDASVGEEEFDAGRRMLNSKN